MDYQCKLCIKLYSSYQSLWNHNKKFHNYNIANITQTTTNITQNTTNLHKNIPCKFCNKYYSRNDSLKRHLRSCDEKIRKDKETELYKQQIEKLNNEIEKLKKKTTKKIINYNTMNNNSNNNNNLTNINNIGKEKSSELSHDEIRYIMSYGMDSVISLAEHLNFNENLPYNHNFYVSALNDKHLNTLDMKTQTIVKQRKKDIFDQILVAHINKLEKMNKNINFKNFDDVLTKLKNAINLKQDKKYYFSKLNMLAYNKRNLIIKTWEELINDETISPDDITETFQKRVLEITEGPFSRMKYNDSDYDSDSE